MSDVCSECGWEHRKGVAHPPNGWSCLATRLHTQAAEIERLKWLLGETRKWLRVASMNLWASTYLDDEAREVDALLSLLSATPAQEVYGECATCKGVGKVFNLSDINKPYDCPACGRKGKGKR